VTYSEFLESKRHRVQSVGFDVELDALNPALFDWQKVIVRWAIKRGRAALFQDCGLGKTPQQLEWARLVAVYTGKPVLILAPLAVSAQTLREAQKFGIEASVSRDGLHHGPIVVTNYERLHYFNSGDFGGIVLDESSILKSFDGVTRKQITDFAKEIRFRLACTATPAPNDLLELSNHAEFLDVMSHKEIIALFFKQDGNTTHQWKLKGHAREAFWEWMAEWSVALRKPADIGFEDDGFVLPALHMMDVVVEGGVLPGELFPLEASTLLERRQARRASLDDRVSIAAGIANGTKAQVLIWCDLNAESEALTKAISGAVEVRGSDTPEYKEQVAEWFGGLRCLCISPLFRTKLAEWTRITSENTISLTMTPKDFDAPSCICGHRSGRRVLVSKSSIFGWGMNFQSCNTMVFVGLSDSYEAFYQAVRRCWRFGQTQEVYAHVVTASTEGAVVKNIKRKEKQAMEMFDEIVKRMRVYEEVAVSERNEMTYAEGDARGECWRMILGDACEKIKEVKTGTVGLSVFSPPFPGMYAYTNSARDVGNVKNITELIDHFGFIMPELLRIGMPGRSCCIHLTQEPVFKGKDGFVGLRDFRGLVIQRMQDAGWIYYGEVTIDKNPQLKASRTKEHSLLFKTLAKDSSSVRMAMADYLLQFRKPGDNPIAVEAGTHGRWNPNGGWITEDEWCEWAAPVWYRKIGENDAQRYPNYPALHQATDGIAETDVLSVRQGSRENDDEKHLCPLQLGVIERAVKLWSAPGDTVFSPFAGIGSEGYKALLLNRRFVGIELKRSYWEVACRNLAEAERQATPADLFPDGAA